MRMLRFTQRKCQHSPGASGTCRVLLDEQSAEVHSKVTLIRGLPGKFSPAPTHILLDGVRVSGPTQIANEKGVVCAIDLGETKR